MMKIGQHTNKDSLLRAYQPTISTLNEPNAESQRGKKGGFFKMWGRKSATAKDALSTEAVDGSHESSSFASGSSERTPITSNNGKWMKPSIAESDDPLSSPTPTLGKKKKVSLSPQSGYSSHSDSPTGVEEFPACNDSDEETPKTVNRRSVSNYFNASAAVMPLPFGYDERVPEVTRQTSKQYKPLLPHDVAKQTQTSLPGPAIPKPTRSMTGQRQSSAPELGNRPVPNQDPISPGKGRKRNSLEEALKSEGQVTLLDRKPSVPTRTTDPSTCGGSIQEPIYEQEVYEQELQHYDRFIPHEAVVDYDERSISPPTIDTRLQSTVDSRSIGSRMHYSVTSRMSTTPKQIPEDPNATIFIPIQPGIRVPLRRCPEVQTALAADFYDTPCCPCCQQQLAVIADAAFMYCPLCREISPLFGNIEAMGDYPNEPEYLRFGLGLGMTWEELKKVRQELFPNHGPVNTM